MQQTDGQTEYNTTLHSDTDYTHQLNNYIK